MTIKRRCSNGHGLYEGLSCPECAKLIAARSDKKRLEKDEGRKIYKSRTWEKCRRNVRLRYHDYDIWLLAIGVKRVCTVPYVHHIIPREEAPDLVFDIDNLVTVSKDSHDREIHPMYKTDRDAAVARIKKGIEEYRKLYGN